jgi:hypothetical protein
MRPKQNTLALIMVLSAAPPQDLEPAKSFFQDTVVHHHFPASAQNFSLEAVTVNLADNISH